MKQRRRWGDRVGGSTISVTRCQPSTLSARHAWSASTRCETPRTPKSFVTRACVIRCHSDTSPCPMVNLQHVPSEPASVRLKRSPFAHRSHLHYGPPEGWCQIQGVHSVEV